MRETLSQAVMTNRRAVVAVAVLIPILLVVSTLAYASMTAAGANSADNGNYGFPGNQHCTTTVSSENAGNDAIQSAITAASPGSVVCVASGTYPEQLTITKSLTLEGLGNSNNPTEIQPTSVVQNSVDPDTSTPEFNIILVGGGASSIGGVTISNVLVDGSLASSSFTSCADGYNGILFLNAGGSITGNTVQNVYLPASLAGCQPGLGIEVQTAAGQSSSVTISNNQVLNYNKNGITCNDAGTTCDVSQNTVTFYVSSVPGAPSTSYSQYIAPNGIQIAFGAIGTVSDNSVSGNECNLGYPTGVCGPNYVDQTQSAGILTYQSGKGTVLNGNTVTDNDIGILTSDDAVTSTNNVVQNNRFEGLYLNDGDYIATDNLISCSKQSSCDIGIAIVSDGYADNPTTVSLDNNFNNGNNLNNNDFRGAFSCPTTTVTTPSTPPVSYTFTCAPVQIVAYIGAPNGGTYSEPATLTVEGFTQTVTAGSSAAPSFVDLTSFPGPFYP